MRARGAAPDVPEPPGITGTFIDVIELPPPLNTRRKKNRSAAKLTPPQHSIPQAEPSLFTASGEATIFEGIAGGEAGRIRSGSCGSGVTGLEIIRGLSSGTAGGGGGVDECSSIEVLGRA